MATSNVSVCCRDKAVAVLRVGQGAPLVQAEIQECLLNSWCHVSYDLLTAVAYLLT